VLEPVSSARIAVQRAVAGVAVAAVGSAAAGLGEAETAAFIAAAAVLLYAGFVASSGRPR
jgi:sulfite exporter TauE/SafE